MGFYDHLLLPFLDQPQSNVVLFVIFSLDTYKNIVTEYKHVISTNYILTSNESLEALSTVII